MSTFRIPIAQGCLLCRDGPCSVTTSRQNRHDIASDPVVTVTKEVNGVTLQLPEHSHIGFPTAMSGDASDPEFYLRKSVVRPSARPRVGPPRSARPPVRPLSIPVRSSARLLRALVRLCARPPTRLPVRSPRPPRPPHIIRGP